MQRRIGELRDELCYGRVERVVPPASLDEDGSSPSQQRSNDGQVEILSSLSQTPQTKGSLHQPSWCCARCDAKVARGGDKRKWRKGKDRRRTMMWGKARPSLHHNHDNRA